MYSIGQGACFLNVYICLYILDLCTTHMVPAEKTTLFLWSIIHFGMSSTGMVGPWKCMKWIVSYCICIVDYDRSSALQHAAGSFCILVSPVCHLSVRAFASGPIVGCWFVTWNEEETWIVPVKQNIVREALAWSSKQCEAPSTLSIHTGCLFGTSVRFGLQV